jgi:hypothetical protein
MTTGVVDGSAVLVLMWSLLWGWCVPCR